MPRENHVKLGKILIVLFAALLISGCDQLTPAPTIDASSDESMKQSAQKVRESLPESERGEFDNAMRLLAFSQIDIKDLFAEGAAGVGNLKGKIREPLHGKTAQEVMAEAERIQLERKTREKEQALNEIKELEQKRVDAAAAREQLKAFEVLRSRFLMEEERYRKQPIIELTVRNATSAAVSRAYFEGTIASPNRSVPWLKETFNYSIPGGLEPGEEAKWRLAPSTFLSGWGNVEIPADAVFTVTVEKLDGADGEALYSTTEFSGRDQERLAELKQKYDVD